MLNPYDSEEMRSPSRLAPMREPRRARGGARYSERSRSRGNADFMNDDLSMDPEFNRVRNPNSGQGLPFMDGLDSSRYLYWICLISIVLLVGVFAVLAVNGILVVLMESTSTDDLTDALAMSYNIQRGIYYGMRAHQFCVAEKMLQCTIDGLDPIACNATAAELAVLCPPIPELAELVSTSGVESALGQSTSPTDELFQSQINELQGLTTTPPPPSPSS